MQNETYYIIYHRQLDATKMGGEVARALLS